MKKALSLLVILALVVLPALAEDKAMVEPAANDVQMGTLMRAMNNVYMVNDGHKTALCGCGKEFEVTAETASMDIHGMTMYACGPECAEQMKTVSAEDMIKGMMEWEKAFTAKEMATNIILQDGKKMATCACNQTFEVTENTPCVIEDGMKLCTCCDGCAKHVMKASAEERHGMLQKAVYTTDKPK